MVTSHNAGVFAEGSWDEVVKAIRSEARKAQHDQKRFRERRSADGSSSVEAD